MSKYTPKDLLAAGKAKVTLSGGLQGAQWGVLAMLLATVGLEFVFSPYWHPFILDNLGGTDEHGKQKLKISSEGFIVVAFLIFATILILTLTGIFPAAGYGVAGLLLLAVVLARAQPIIDWIDVTTSTLKTASGA